MFSFHYGMAQVQEEYPGMAGGGIGGDRELWDPDGSRDAGEG